MAAIHPFHGLRYNEPVAGTLTELIAPPYDVIEPEEQDRLYQRSAHNAVRLILGKAQPGDTAEQNVYTRARKDYDAWKTERALIRDSDASLYIVSHTFQSSAGTPSERIGFFALLGLDGPQERTVLKHEATLAGPKADRTKLLEAIPANLEPIFCVYPDAGAAVQQLLSGFIAHTQPTAEATLYGEQIRLWRLTEPTTIAQIAGHLRSVQVLIADGHHRFEVAFANRSRYPAVMAYFASMEDPGLFVRPIHRIVSTDASAALKQLESACGIRVAESLEAVTQWLSRERSQGRYGVYAQGRFYHVTVREELLRRWLDAPTVPAPLAILDVCLLHGMLLPQIGVNGTGVRYTGKLPEALRAVDSGKAGLTCLLRPIPLEQVYTLAKSGQILPPKSTYFYPKVPSGLVINSFEDVIST